MDPIYSGTLNHDDPKRLRAEKVIQNHIDALVTEDKTTDGIDEKLVKGVLSSAMLPEEKKTRQSLMEVGTFESSFPTGLNNLIQLSSKPEYAIQSDIYTTQPDLRSHSTLTDDIIRNDLIDKVISVSDYEEEFKQA